MVRAAEIASAAREVNTSRTRADAAAASLIDNVTSTGSGAALKNLAVRVGAFE